MRELNDAKQPIVWQKHSLEEARRALFLQLVQRAVSDTLVRMTCDDDVETEVSSILYSAHKYHQRFAQSS